MSSQYILILNQKQRITTYRCEHINYLVKEVIDEILTSYGFEPSEMTSKDFDFKDFRDLYDLNYFEAKSLKELFQFREKIENVQFELNDNSKYEFPLHHNPDWSLKIEPKYGSLIIHGFTNVDKQYPTNFHIEKL
jgi:hypothetical protein